MTTRLENLTPHPITIRTGEGDKTFSPKGPPCRVDYEARQVDKLFGVPVRTLEYGKVRGLPPMKEGVAYLVSDMVRQALVSQGAERPDVFSPATGPKDGAIRDERGYVMAVTQLNVASA